MVQGQRMSDDARKEGPWFRFIIGLMALGGALGGFFALFWIEIPARNENALLLALGFVMGWAGAVIASEYGATTTGRKVAESAVRTIERQQTAAEDLAAFEREAAPADARAAADEMVEVAVDKAEEIKGKPKGT